MLSQVDIDDYEQPDFVPLSEFKEGDSFEYKGLIYKIDWSIPPFVCTDAGYTFPFDFKVKKL